jgi:hypothetical protein
MESEDGGDMYGGKRNCCAPFIGPSGRKKCAVYSGTKKHPKCPTKAQIKALLSNYRPKAAKKRKCCPGQNFAGPTGKKRCHLYEGTRKNPVCPGAYYGPASAPKMKYRPAKRVRPAICGSSLYDYPGMPYMVGASAKGEAAAARNPWLKHMASIRAMCPGLPASKIAKIAHDTYFRG